MEIRGSYAWLLTTLSWPTQGRSCCCRNQKEKGSRKQSVLRRSNSFWVIFMPPSVARTQTNRNQLDDATVTIRWAENSRLKPNKVLVYEVWASFRPMKKYQHFQNCKNWTHALLSGFQTPFHLSLLRGFLFYRRHLKSAARRAWNLRIHMQIGMAKENPSFKVR